MVLKVVGFEGGEVGEIETGLGGCIGASVSKLTDFFAQGVTF